MSDLISREAAIDALAEMYCKSDEDGYVWIIRGDACKKIDALPSAQRWIPVSERLPEDNEYVLVTTAEGGVTDAKYWHRERIWVKGLAIVNVTAWMSLPNPWEGEEDESNRTT